MLKSPYLHVSCAFEAYLTFSAYVFLVCVIDKQVFSNEICVVQGSTVYVYVFSLRFLDSYN